MWGTIGVTSGNVDGSGNIANTCMHLIPIYGVEAHPLLAQLERFKTRTTFHVRDLAA